MHTHVSALTAVQIFLMVLILGTLWKLGTAALVRNFDGVLDELGRAGSFQYGG